MTHDYSADVIAKLEKVAAGTTGRLVIVITAKSNANCAAAISGPLLDLRNSRSVWRIPTENFPGRHFATFPREIPRRAISAGCPAGGTVLGIFAGSGTTCSVACEMGLNFIGLELYPENVQIACQYRSFQVGIPMPVQQRAAP